MTFAKVVADSGLAKTELAVLYGVSRQTIHGWTFIGPPREGTLLARQAEVITAALCNAIDKGVLPLNLSRAIPSQRDLRKSRVGRMAVTLSNLKPAPAK